VIALLKKLPAEYPPFETVQDRVLADYKHSQATSTARRAGNDFSRAVTNGMAAGKTFAAICAEAKVTPVTLPPISMNTRELPQLGDKVSLYQLFQVAFETQPGKVSDFSPTADGGFLVHVKERLPTDPAKMAAEMPEFLTRVRQARRQEAINMWLQKEASRSLSETPLMQTRPAGPSALPEPS
jgi:hypothetical protein